MWTYEPFVGTTVYFDEKRTVSLATTAYWELHGNKKDTDARSGSSSRSKAVSASHTSAAG